MYSTKSWACLSLTAALLLATQVKFRLSNRVALSMFNCDQLPTTLPLAWPSVMEFSSKSDVILKFGYFISSMKSLLSVYFHLMTAFGNASRTSHLIKENSPSTAYTSAIFEISGATK
jgi:hypothetical protein